METLRQRQVAIYRPNPLALVFHPCFAGQDAMATMGGGDRSTSGGARAASSGRAGAAGTARRRREQRARADGRHVSWLASLLAQTGHHTSCGFGLGEVVRLQREVKELQAAVKHLVAQLAVTTGKAEEALSAQAAVAEAASQAEKERLAQEAARQAAEEQVAQAAAVAEAQAVRTAAELSQAQEASARLKQSAQEAAAQYRLEEARGHGSRDTGSARLPDWLRPPVRVRVVRTGLVGYVDSIQGSLITIYSLDESVSVVVKAGDIERLEQVHPAKGGRKRR